MRKAGEFGEFFLSVCRVVRSLTTRDARSATAPFVLFRLRRNDRLQRQREFRTLKRSQIPPPQSSGREREDLDAGPEIPMRPGEKTRPPGSPEEGGTTLNQSIGAESGDINGGQIQSQTLPA